MPGEVVQIWWNDHHGFQEYTPGMEQPILQKTTGTVALVSLEGVLVKYDEYVREPARFSGGFILGSCITKAVVWGRDSE